MTNFHEFTFGRCRSKSLVLIYNLNWKLACYRSDERRKRESTKGALIECLYEGLAVIILEARLFTPTPESGKKSSKFADVFVYNLEITRIKEVCRKRDSFFSLSEGSNTLGCVPASRRPPIIHSSSSRPFTNDSLFPLHSSAPPAQRLTLPPFFFSTYLVRGCSSFFFISPCAVDRAEVCTVGTFFSG